ncbi:hypothetical protein [Streptomyces sp. AK02-04a]|uniref:hypothetical protein n=1 Tax=Streptomyces sp. AK02-04a TaxID=3028649 RepID=UPI0029BB0B98|nr:hypothetical protein [Streptomyces sp. AK02-04a]MDX3763659.1 hypothetical protein [Streptomyces sp. AK02-04a]
MKRKPSEYEVVNAQFLHSFRREPAPFEISPDAPVNQWYRRYREGSPFQVEDWESFRDPHRLTYRQYVLQQHGRETYVDALIDEHESAASIENLQPEYVQVLRKLAVPMRFPLHVLQMVSMYVSQMAPTAYIVNCAAFQAGDELRRIQWLAYWVKSLSLAHGDHLAATATARDTWEKDPAWQPLRRALEHLLAVRDWGEAFAALNLALKPALDTLLNGSLALLAKQNGDALLASLLKEFGQDSRRSRDWSTALTLYALEQRPELRGSLSAWTSPWQRTATDAVSSLSGLFTEAPSPLEADDVADHAAAQLNTINQDCGLS